jgi:hypothetical protein
VVGGIGMIPPVELLLLLLLPVDEEEEEEEKEDEAWTMTPIMTTHQVPIRSMDELMDLKFFFEPTSLSLPKNPTKNKSNNPIDFNREPIANT